MIEYEKYYRELCKTKLKMQQDLVKIDEELKLLEILIREKPKELENNFYIKSKI